MKPGRKSVGAGAKDPAFPLYVKDILVDCAWMSNEQIGAYFRLLCYAWAKLPGCEPCSLPDDDNELARLVGSRPVFFKKKIAPAIRRCLETRDGFLWSKRLLEVYAERAKYIEQKRKAGEASARSRWGDPADKVTGVTAPLVTDGQRKGNLPSPSPSPSKIPPRVPPSKCKHGQAKDWKCPACGSWKRVPSRAKLTASRRRYAEDLEVDAAWEWSKFILWDFRDWRSDVDRTWQRWIRTARERQGKAYEPGKPGGDPTQAKSQPDEVFELTDDERALFERIWVPREPETADCQYWTQVVGELHTRSDGHAITTWFTPTDLVGIDAQDLIVSAPTTVFVEWISANYRDLILEILSDLNFPGIKGFRIVLAGRYAAWRAQAQEG